MKNKLNTQAQSQSLSKTYPAASHRSSPQDRMRAVPVSLCIGRAGEGSTSQFIETQSLLQTKQHLDEAASCRLAFLWAMSDYY